MTQTKEQLEERRTEILAQLEKVNEDLRQQLDSDPEEQAIEVENDQVAVTMESNLRRELAVIEDQLLDLERS